MSYSERIKSLQPIRHYVRDFFVLGFKSRDDFSEKSGRSYDDMLRRIRSWLEDYLRNPGVRQKKYALSIAARKEPENPLYRVFCTKTFTEKDVLLHFFLVDFLAKGPLSTSQLWEMLSEIYPAPDLPDESTVRKKCDEYAKLGIFRKEKDGRRMTYALSSPLPLSGSADALSMAAETEPAGVLGFFLHQKTAPSDFPLAFKHRYLFQALDSEIAYALLLAIREKKTADIELERGEKRRIFPIKLYISRESGREYVLCAEKDRPYFLRLDRIETAKPAKPFEETPAADISTHIWGVSNRTDRLWHVEMTVRVAPDEDFIVRRLRREKRGGTVTSKENGLWTYEADVCDPLEMIPWLRTYIGRIVSLKSDHPYLVKRFKNDLAKMNCGV